MEADDHSRLEVTVLRAHGLPRQTNPFGKKRSFYVTLTDGTTTKKTIATRGDKQAVEWNEELAFGIHPSSRITLSLYSERSRHEHQLFGTLDIPVEPQTNIPFLVGRAPQVTLYLTINVVSSPNPIPSELDSTPVVALLPVAHSTISSPSTSTQLISDTQAEMSNTNAEKALHDAGNAVEAMDCYQRWEQAVGRIEWVMNSLSSIAELYPYAKIAIGLLLVIPKTFLTQVQLDTKIKTLLDAIHDAFDFAQDASSLQNIKPESKQANILILMLGHIGNCCDFIQSYARDKNFWIRILKNVGGQGDKQISDLCSTFTDLRRSFLELAGLTTEISVFQILDDVGVVSAKISGISTRLHKMTTQLSGQISDLDLEHKMGEIPYRTRWRSGIERNYIPGTRTDFLDHITKWVNDPDAKRGLVLFGQAGTGKSSIAHEIGRRFQAMNRLTSYFSFLRAEQTKREDYHLFTTIIHDLSKRYPSFKTALGNIIRDDKALRTAQQYEPIFESMLLQPLKDVHIVGPVLVIIDALDESGDTTGHKGLHSFLAERLAELPPNFRVFITSRLEFDIVDQFNRVETAFNIVRIDDPNLSATTDDDVRLYLQKNLPRNTYERYGNQLATKVEGLFQWAAVACGLINTPPPGLTRSDCVHGLLADRADLGQDLSPLNKLYNQVLERYFGSDFVLRRFRSVIGQLLVAFEPLSIQSLTSLRHLSGEEYDDDSNGEESVLAIIGHLGSLLSNVTSADWTLPIVPLHTSFRDFLTDHKWSGPFFIDIEEAHCQLACSCLGLMLGKLKFNICELPSSYYPNDKIDDLQFRLSKHISPALIYACCFWDDHLGRVRFGRDLFAQVRTLFEENFLFWLEVLSLKNSVDLASPALSSLVVWLASVQQSEDVGDDVKMIEEFAIDAGSFVRYFGMAIAMSAPHIYVSALPFTPTSSRVYQQYSNLFPNTLGLIRGQLSHWPAMELNIAAQSRCTSVGFSPDGQHIVSGFWDHTICMWNATTGHMEGRPFTGHTSDVTSVAFSPDGQWIVSGSNDMTVRVWNVTSGAMEGSPFTGHTHFVSSVAFSPDGQRIVSGSWSSEVRVWNASTGKMEGGSFTGHTSTVTSVAFSPDGQRIISGSIDRTVCMWNARTGAMVGSPFTGHNGSVTSVAFSPDGQRVVSGSGDSTICLWNTSTGKMEGIPFTGHTGPVNSVAFSPDGQSIVSGSYDRTICLWNASTGQLEGSPFTGHVDSVTSVAFSPDGQRIVSGSFDSTIRLWNASPGSMEGRAFTGQTASVNTVAFSADGQQIVSGSGSTIHLRNTITGAIEGISFIGHSASVDSVGFSPDGRRIVSGSSDKTICVWNADTGVMEGGPLIGRPGSGVNSVGFSPDGQRIVSGAGDCAIHVWNANTGAVEVRFTGHTHWVTSVAFSPDGQHIVSGSNDCTIRMWNSDTGAMEGDPFTGHTAWVNSVGFSPDGQHVVSSSMDHTIRVWSATSGQMEGSLLTGHTDSVTSVAFSPDGQHIVSSSRDSTVRVWDTATGQLERSLLRHANAVISVAFSPDGQQIVSGSIDGTLHLWDVFCTDSDMDIPFFDSSVIDYDGWIRTSSDDKLLLVWIPSVHRLSLYRPTTIWIDGGHETQLDFSNFVHGSQWPSCYQNS